MYKIIEDDDKKYYIIIVDCVYKKIRFHSLIMFTLFVSLR